MPLSTELQSKLKEPAYTEKQVTRSFKEPLSADDIWDDLVEYAREVHGLDITTEYDDHAAFRQYVTDVLSSETETKVVALDRLSRSLKAQVARRADARPPAWDTKGRKAWDDARAEPEPAPER